MSRKSQSYSNRGKGFRLFAQMAAMFGSMYNSVFNRNQRNTGRAGGHLDTSYYGGGGSSSGDTKSDQNTKKFRHKAKIEKKRKRKDRQKSQRINRKRQAGICSFK